jgi:hypothetical protein
VDGKTIAKRSAERRIIAIGPRWFSKNTAVSLINRNGFDRRLDAERANCIDHDAARIFEGQ